jgi:hypothetical protein
MGQSAFRRCLALVAVAASAIVVGPRPAVAAETCRVDEVGILHADPYTSEITQCIDSPDGPPTWQVPQPGVTPQATNALATAVKQVAGSVGSALQTARSGQPAAGTACAQKGRVMLSPTDGTRLECGDDGQWSAIAPSPQQPPSSRLPSPLLPASPDVPGGDPLDPDLGNPTGLAPGVSLPPGTTMLAGSPERLPSQDYFKNAEWMIQATVASTDLEAVNQHFGEQCAAIGWVYDPAAVERFPEQNPPNRSYDRSVTMVAGQCRTVAGSEEERWKQRPWFLAWSVALRPGATRTELVVELRSNTRLGGRP